MSREKILIAEDDQDVRNICVRVLCEENYQITAVENGLLAVEAVRQNPFDMLLTDIKMPCLDGLETARRIKALYPDIVCVIMTGFGTMDTAIKALRLGADEFLVKPFTPDALSAAVAKALEKVRLRRENIRLRALIPLFELSRALMSTVTQDELLPQVLKVAQIETQADKAALLLLSPDGQQLASQTGQDFDVQPWPDLAVKAARVSEQLILSNQSGTTASAPPWGAQLLQAGVHTAIVTPLISKTQPLGALIVAKTPPQDHFAPSDPELLSILCGQAAIAIENARLFQEIQQAYQELKQLDRLKSEFINIAAHELRTPLAILMGHASLLAEELDGPAGERLQVIMRNAVCLRALIKDILTLRTLESGSARLRPEECDLRELIETSTSDLRWLAEDKQQQAIIVVEDEMPFIMADRQRLNLVLSNLLSNAIKFAPEGGCITIRGRLDGNDVVISVEDNGIGIPSDKLDRIFERFYQVEDSLTREHGGIGLGLAIVKGMVQLWNGRVWVQSEVGQGSTFTFTIPQPVPVPA